MSSPPKNLDGAETSLLGLFLVLFPIFILLLYLAFSIGGKEGIRLAMGRPVLICDD